MAGHEIESEVVFSAINSNSSLTNPVLKKNHSVNSNKDLHPNLVSNLCSLVDLAYSIFLRKVHEEQR